MTVHPWRERRPSRLKVLGVYSKRAVLRNFNSRPFLSGDLFCDNADYVFRPTEMRLNRSWYKSLKNAKVIFCKGSDLDDFLSEYSDVITAKVILAGNSDRDFYEEPKVIPKSVKHLFLQNSFISDGKKFSTLPIGIENIRYGVNGLPWHMESDSKVERINRILMGPFGLTHPDRLSAFEYFTANCDSVDLLMNRLTPTDFAAIMRSYRFIAAIRGNGVDTHRLWESLYRGCIPILKDDAWSRSLSSLNLPIQYVSEWDNEYLNPLISSKETPFNPRDLQALWWPFWKRVINEKI